MISRSCCKRSGSYSSEADQRRKHIHCLSTPQQTRGGQSETTTYCNVQGILSTCRDVQEAMSSIKGNRRAQLPSYTDLLERAAVRSKGVLKGVVACVDRRPLCERTTAVHLHYEQDLVEQNSDFRCNMWSIMFAVITHRIRTRSTTRTRQHPRDIPFAIKLSVHHQPWVAQVPAWLSPLNSSPRSYDPSSKPTLWPARYHRTPTNCSQATGLPNHLENRYPYCVSHRAHVGSCPSLRQ